VETETTYKWLFFRRIQIKYSGYLEILLSDFGHCIIRNSNIRLVGRRRSKGETTRKEERKYEKKSKGDLNKKRVTLNSYGGNFPIKKRC